MKRVAQWLRGSGCLVVITVLVVTGLAFMRFVVAPAHPQSYRAEVDLGEHALPIACAEQALNDRIPGGTRRVPGLGLSLGSPQNPIVPADPGAHIVITARVEHGTTRLVLDYRLRDGDPLAPVPQAMVITKMTEAISAIVRQCAPALAGRWRAVCQRGEQCPSVGENGSCS